MPVGPISDEGGFLQTPPNTGSAAWTYCLSVHFQYAIAQQLQLPLAVPAVQGLARVQIRQNEKNYMPDCKNITPQILGLGLSTPQDLAERNMT